MKYIKQIDELFKPIIDTSGSMSTNNIKPKGIIYYLIPTDDRLEDSLEKTGCSDYYRKQFMRNQNVKPYKYIFINKYEYYNKIQWNWSRFKDIEQDIAMEQIGSIYGGKINIEDSEIQAHKYNI